MSISKLALFTAVIAAQACSKSKDGNDDKSDPVETPALSSVAPEGYKNTASSAREVGERVGQVQVGLAQSNLGLTGTTQRTSAPKESERTIDLMAAKFLAGQTFQIAELSIGDWGVGQEDRDFPDQNEDFGLAAGSDCQNMIRSIDEAYNSTVAGLKSSADELITLDEKLPKGVTKLPPSDRFAVGYAADFSSWIDESQTEAGEMPKISGFGNLSAGANDSAVGIEASVDVSAQMPASTGTPAASSRVQAGFAAYADAPAQTIKLKSNMVLNQVSGEAPVSISTSFGMVLAGGVQPSVSIDGSASGNFVDANGKPKRVSGNGSVALKKKSESELTLVYSVTVNKATKSDAVVLAADQFGRCVVK